MTNVLLILLRIDNIFIFKWDIDMTVIVILGSYANFINPNKLDIMKLYKFYSIHTSKFQVLTKPKTRKTQAGQPQVKHHRPLQSDSIIMTRQCNHAKRLNLHSKLTDCKMCLLHRQVIVKRCMIKTKITISLADRWFVATNFQSCFVLTKPFTFRLI